MARLVVADFGCKVVPNVALVEAVRDLQARARRQRYVHKAMNCGLTNSGTSLLIMSCTFFESEALFEKFTRYFKLNVRVTAWFISIRTPSKSSSSSSSSCCFLAFFAGLLDCTQPQA